MARGHIGGSWSLAALRPRCSSDMVHWVVCGEDRGILKDIVLEKEDECLFLSCLELYRSALVVARGQTFSGVP